MKLNIKTLNRTMLAAAFVAGAGISTQVMAGEKQPGDFARGAMQWVENCGRCHNVRDPRELRDDQWKTTVYHMRIRAGLTGQQTRDILTFLQESN